MGVRRRADKPEEVSIVATDGTVTDGPYPETKAVIGGFSIVDVPSREEALEWAAKIAVACRCAQEVREFMPDPAVDDRSSTRPVHGDGPGALARPSGYLVGKRRSRRLPVDPLRRVPLRRGRRERLRGQLLPPLALLACVPLTFVGERTATVRFGVGRRCFVGRSSASFVPECVVVGMAGVRK